MIYKRIARTIFLHTMRYILSFILILLITAPSLAHKPDTSAAPPLRQALLTAADSAEAPVVVRLAQNRRVQIGAIGAAIAGIGVYWAVRHWRPDQSWVIDDRTHGGLIFAVGTTLTLKQIFGH